MITSGEEGQREDGEVGGATVFSLSHLGGGTLASSGWGLQQAPPAKNNPTPMSIIPRYRKNMQSIIKHFLTLVGALSIELRCNFYFLLLQIHVSKISIRRVL